MTIYQKVDKLLETMTIKGAIEHFVNQYKNNRLKAKKLEDQGKDSTYLYKRNDNINIAIQYINDKETLKHFS